MIARLRRAALLVALAGALVSGAAPALAAGPCDFSARLWPAGAKSITEGETEALDRLIRECPDCTDIIAELDAEQEKLAVELTRCRHQCRQ